MYLFNITSLPKLNIDGADFYAKLEVEQRFPDTHLMKNHKLSNWVKKSIIHGAERVESFGNTDNVSRNMVPFFSFFKALDYKNHK